MNITVSAYNRPDYLERTLSALSRCHGVGDCRVAVLLDPCEETPRQWSLATKFGFEVVQFSSHVGCNLAICGSLTYGFGTMGSEYHVHLEDDTVPTRDCLRWFAWAGEKYRGNPGVLDVSGYHKIGNGHLDQCGLRRWFTPWGWATWKDRWLGLQAGWHSAADGVSWDVVVNHVLRASRYEVFPTVSRIQNIGAEKGTHVPSAEWHAENHHVPVTADDLPDLAAPDFHQTIVDEMTE
jgi:hypothetical protein